MKTGQNNQSATRDASAKTNHKRKLRNEWSADRTIHIKGDYITLHGALATRVRKVCRKAGITPQEFYANSLREGLQMRHVPVEMTQIYWHAAETKAKAQGKTMNEYLVGLLRRDIASAEAGSIKLDPAVRAKIQKALDENIIPCSVEWFVANSAEHVAEDLGDMDLADGIRREWKAWKDAQNEGKAVAA